jgi:segregation and condensation protein B
LVKIAGRAEIPGRPLLYETTQFFLDHFGLRNLDELPNAEELRKRYLPMAQPVAGIGDTARPDSSPPATTNL